MTVKLDHHHRHTVEQIFGHPLQHNIKWPDVVSLLERFGEVRESHRGGWVCHTNGVTTSFGRAKGSDLTTDQVMKVRHLLTSQGVTAASAAA